MTQVMVNFKKRLRLNNSQIVASNGLVANESKTVFIMINSKKSRAENSRKIRICNSEVTESMEKVVCCQA
jgi:hypothetical protein